MTTINYAHVSKRQCIGGVQPGWYYHFSDGADGDDLAGDVWQEDIDRNGWCGPYRTEGEARVYAEAETVISEWIDIHADGDRIKVPPSLVGSGVLDLLTTFVDTHGGVRRMVSVCGGEYLPDADLRKLLRAVRLDTKDSLHAINNYLKREGE